MIHDVHFLSDSQIVCSSHHIIDGFAYPCIDVYDIPRVVRFTVPDLATPPDDWWTSIETAHVRSLPHIVSFQLPRWKCPPMTCAWCPSRAGFYRISEFTLKLPRPSEAASMREQVMTFRLEGRDELRKKEALHGAILLSKIHAIVQEIAAEQLAGVAIGTRIKEQRGLRARMKSGSAVDPRQLSNGPTYVKWNKWSFAVSLHDSKTSSVLEPMGTQVAKIARFRTNRMSAVMLIRDYNQAMLYAPPGNMNRLLGHPIDNKPVDPFGGKVELPETFKVKTGHKSLSSKLFLGELYYGLGHREKAIQLRDYVANTASPRLFWDEGSRVAVVHQTPGVSQSVWPLGGN